MAGISGVGVGVATIGGLLAYAGFRGVNPIEALREIASGNPPAAQNTGADLNSYIVGEVPTTSGTQVIGTGSALVLALGKFAGDKYSQARRWQDGYSDCSSFIGKGWKAIGVTPPGGSTTWEYLAWSKLSKISRADVGAGDLICNTSHIVCAIDNHNAIGQENPTVNVKVDTIENLMTGTGSFTCLRYKYWGGAALGEALVAQNPTTHVLGVTQ